MLKRGIQWLATRALDFVFGKPEEWDCPVCGEEQHGCARPACPFQTSP